MVLSGQLHLVYMVAKLCGSSMANYGGNSKTLKSFNIMTGDWTDHLQEQTVLALTESSSQQMWAETDHWQCFGL